MSLATNPAQPWFRLLTQWPELNRVTRVKRFLEDTRRLLLEVASKSNTYGAFSQMYVDLPVFGTSAVYFSDHPTDVLNGCVLPIGSYYLAQDQFYRTNTMYRRTTLTVEQLARRFGIDRLSMATKSLYDRKQYDTGIEVVHLVEPNDKLVHGNMDRTGMPWRSVWYEVGNSGDNNRKLLGWGGYHEFPVMAPRWEIRGEDTYGANCPGMECLGDARAVQTMERRKAQVLDKITTPPMNAPSSMQNSRKSLLSGDTNYLPAGAQGQKFEPAYVPNAGALALREEIAAHELRINQAFLADLLLMFAGGNRDPTATEIEARQAEKMLQLGTLNDRLNKDLLDPFIDREFGICLRKGMLPDIPDELHGIDLRVEYVSPMAQAQKLTGVAGMERLIAAITGLLQVKPSAADKLNADKAIDEMADMLGVSPALVYSDEEVAEIRAQQQQQISPEAAKGTRDMSDAAKKLSETTLSDDSALAGMVRNIGAVAA